MRSKIESPGVVRRMKRSCVKIDVTPEMDASDMATTLYVGWTVWNMMLYESIDMGRSPSLLPVRNNSHVDGCYQLSGDY